MTFQRVLLPLHLRPFLAVSSGSWSTGVSPVWKQTPAADISWPICPQHNFFFRNLSSCLEAATVGWIIQSLSLKVAATHSRMMWETPVRVIIKLGKWRVTFFHSAHWVWHQNNSKTAGAILLSAWQYLGAHTLFLQVQMGMPF